MGEGVYWLWVVDNAFDFRFKESLCLWVSGMEL